MHLRLTAAALCAAVLPFAVPAGAQAASPPQRMSTSVVVKKFVVRGTGLTALGDASTTVGGQGAKQAVELVATTGANCQVLTLRLDTLNLALLGLRLDVSAVNLKITGNRDRTLGALFCKLATAKNLGSLTGTRKAAASLNRRLKRTPLRMIGVNAMLYPSTTQAQPRASTRGATASGPAPTTPVCPVLDLTLGPLNLDLLGLVVDLYGRTPTDPVRVTAVADPNGGIVGKALCQLSTQAPPA